LNIWILNHYAITPDTPGGTRHYDFAKVLTARGHDVSVVASSFHYGRRKESRSYGGRNHLEENHDGIRFVWLKTFPYSDNGWRRVVNMLSYAAGAYKVARNRSAELAPPDVIIGSSVHLFAVYSAYRLSKRFRVPFVMEVRDLWPQSLIDMGISKWHPFVMLFGLLEKYLYGKADRIISLLPKASEYIEGLGISREKIIWIPNGVDLARFPHDEDESRPRNQRFILTYTGAIGKANHLEVAIDAAEMIGALCPDVDLLFVGDGPEKAGLMRLVEEKGLGNVSFSQPLPKSRIGDVLRSSDALFLTLADLPVYKFGISLNKLFDYLASGKPIIFASNSAIDPVKDAGAGLTIPPDDPKKLADAVFALRTMTPEERLEMGRNGRRYVEKHHSIEVLADRLEDMLSELTSARGY